MSKIVHRPGKTGGILSGKGHAQRVGRAPCLTGEEHFLDRPLARPQRALELAAPLRQLAGFGIELLAFRAQVGERPIGIGDGALGIAQPVARFAAGFFLPQKLLGEGVDPVAQRLQVFLTGCGVRRGCPPR
jgi:hypothetical protein